MRAPSSFLAEMRSIDPKLSVTFSPDRGRWQLSLRAKVKEFLGYIDGKPFYAFMPYNHLIATIGAREILIPLLSIKRIFTDPAELDAIPDQYLPLDMRTIYWLGYTYPRSEEAARRTIQDLDAYNDRVTAAHDREEQELAHEMAKDMHVGYNKGGKIGIPNPGLPNQVTNIERSQA